MSTYVVSTDASDWTDDRFKTRPPADQCMKEKLAAGHKLVRLIRWEKGKPNVMEEVKR